MRFATVALLVACTSDPQLPPPTPPSQGGPFAIVYKLENYERHVTVDANSLVAFAAGIEPASFRITMTTYLRGTQDAIFHREYLADGTWLSSSPSPGIIIDDTPSVEPACDGCHADFAESIGMFTLHALRAAAVVDTTATISCEEAGTTPCPTSVYRDVAF